MRPKRKSNENKELGLAVAELTPERAQQLGLNPDETLKKSAERASQCRIQAATHNPGERLLLMGDP